MTSTPTRSRAWLALAALAAVLAVLAPFFSGGGAATDASSRADGSEACTAEALARVNGVEIGDALDDFHVDAIACPSDSPCARVDLTHDAQALTLRVCPHVEGALVPYATHGTDDVFYDVPATPDGTEPPIDTVHRVIDAFVASLAAPQE